MDKIVKNNTIMGVIALATFALVAVMFFKNRRNEKTTAELPAPIEEK